VHVDAPARQATDDLLAILAQLDGLEGQLRIGLDDAYHVANGRIGVEPQEQVGGCQVEKVHRVRLDHLTHVQQLAQQARRAGGRRAGDSIAGLGRGQVVAHRTDAADARCDDRHLVVHAPLGELFKAAELVDV